MNSPQIKVLYVFKVGIDLTTGIFDTDVGSTIDELWQSIMNFISAEYGWACEDRGIARNPQMLDQAYCFRISTSTHWEFRNPQSGAAVSSDYRGSGAAQGTFTYIATALRRN
ncbi:MAG: hypothetical protein EOP04_28815 [Proteobacteria bacterium]|nr:MAG: hypothetical protein EOP04_28815 [Pseudomonadota bacterium]